MKTYHFIMFYNCYKFLSLPHRQASIDFSLILTFENTSRCTDLNDINEGILLKATDHLNFTKNLNFYYSTKENNYFNDSNIVPMVINHGSMVTLKYSSIIFNVTATFANSTGLLNFSKNVNDILNRICSISWEQYTVNMSLGQDCDVWSLDNLAVTVQYENSTREVFNEDFEGDFK